MECLSVLANFYIGEHKLYMLANICPLFIGMYKRILRKWMPGESEEQTFRNKRNNGNGIQYFDVRNSTGEFIDNRRIYQSQKHLLY